MLISLIDNTHAHIIDRPKVHLIFREEADKQLENAILGM